MSMKTATKGPMSVIAEAADGSTTEQFTAYVKDITAYQRREVRKRVEKIAHHESLNSAYFWGCQAGAIGASIVAQFLWGPRNVMTDKMYFLRPIGPVIILGITSWALLHQMRGYIMKLRFWTMVEDFDYELKRVKGHHVKEGALHLAWLQFVCEQVRQEKSQYMNVEALEHEPMLQIPKDPKKLRL